ncbi:MAG: DsbA family protein [Longimicrobiales bacterium]
MNERLWNAATIAVMLCALATTGLVVRREFVGRASDSVRKPRDVGHWDEITSAGHREGPQRAAVVLVEFADYQCEFCRALAPILDSLRVRHPSDVAVIYRHFPLVGRHPHATQAALAAECARAQGKFKAYQAVLYDQQASIGETSFEEYAGLAGVKDMNVFQRCIAEQTPMPQLEEDVRLAQKLGLRWTPSIIVNGMLLPGTPTLLSLDSIVRAAVDR